MWEKRHRYLERSGWKLHAFAAGQGLGNGGVCKGCRQARLLFLFSEILAGKGTMMAGRIANGDESCNAMQ